MKPSFFAVLLLAFAAGGEAAAQADRRDPFTVELSVGGAWSGSPTSGNDGGRGAFALEAFGPFAEAFQGGIGSQVTFRSRDLPGGGSEVGVGATLLAGGRWLSGFEEWQTRLDAQLAVDVWPSFALGVRGAAGGLWRIAPGLRVGVELGVLVLVGRLRFGADASLVTAWSW